MPLGLLSPDLLPARRFWARALGSTRAPRRTPRPAHCSASGEAAPSATNPRTGAAWGGPPSALPAECSQCLWACAPGPQFVSTRLAAGLPAANCTANPAIRLKKWFTPQTYRRSVWFRTALKHPHALTLYAPTPTASVGGPQSHSSTRPPENTWPPQAPLARMTGPVLQ